jgi:hypothetical protein
MRSNFRISIFALSAILLGAAAGQERDGQNTHNLELRLQADQVKRGKPPTFHLLLVNRTDHDVHVGLPAPNCNDPYNGSFEVERDFKPLGGRSKPTGPKGGCEVDGTEFPPILDRIGDKDWKVLHAGDALSLNDERADPNAPRKVFFEIVPAGGSPSQPGMAAFENDSKLGTYEVRAAYYPPLSTDTDKASLQKQSIDYPHERLLANLRFLKNK